MQTKFYLLSTNNSMDLNKNFLPQNNRNTKITKGKYRS